MNSSLTIGFFVHVIRTFFRPFHPRQFPYLRFGATVALGLAAGWLFVQFNIPLPWMLGPLVATTLAALMHIPVSAPAVVRPPMSNMIGVMLGAGFTPDMLSKAPQWLGTLAIQVVLMVLLAVIGSQFYRRAGKLDPVTALYAGMPGGLMEMSMLAEEKGGDGQVVALIHSARILFIVMTVPFIVQWLEHVQLGPRQASNLSVMDAPATTFLWIVALAVAGNIVGRLLRLPIAPLFGPMFLSMAVHGFGITDFIMPREIVIVAQIVFGCIIGCRFSGYATREIIRILIMSLGATVLLLIVTLAFCYAAWAMLGLPLSQLLLAYAPAGIAEMSLIALALHFDTAFVMTHQLVRLLLVGSSGGLTTGGKDK